MSKKLFFINDTPSEIQTLLRVISRSRILRECQAKGLPEPTNLNKFCVIVTKGSIRLCYHYFKNPTTVLDLDVSELPHKGWRLYVSSDTI